jgi:hypothetical protein
VLNRPLICGLRLAFRRPPKDDLPRACSFHAPAIVAVSILLMLIRPGGRAEVYWISAGALLLIALRLASLKLAWRAVGEGSDVYLFLIAALVITAAVSINTRSNPIKPRARSAREHYVWWQDCFIMVDGGESIGAASNLVNRTLATSNPSYGATICAHAIRAPALPVGSVIMSSAFS